MSGQSTQTTSASADSVRAWSVCDCDFFPFHSQVILIQPFLVLKEGETHTVKENAGNSLVNLYR